MLLPHDMMPPAPCEQLQRLIELTAFRAQTSLLQNCPSTSRQLLDRPKTVRWQWSWMARSARRHHNKIVAFAAEAGAKLCQVAVLA